MIDVVKFGILGTVASVTMFMLYRIAEAII